jgi:cytochrome P450
MILFPEVQEKAQAEIDSVIGMDRLPTFDDRNALPYVEAVICETLRWHPAVPLGQICAVRVRTFSYIPDRYGSRYDHG